MQTKSVKSVSEHPIHFYYDYGLRITVNTDNRLMSNTSVTDELAIVADQFQFDLNDIGNIIINGFKSAFISYAEKKHMLEDILAELRDFGYDSDYLRSSTETS